ncbi:MAG: ATP-binding protein [Propionibacteriaceae bacterium]|jgi:predicted AAA+ superfamily ATPase|nr:ATP-binding protein [Propionibacteriaceae bacterium]
MAELVDRPVPLAWLARWQNRDVIKVVTGVRRCGKSTLLYMFRERLKAAGVPADSIVAINLEDPAYLELLPDPKRLYDHIVSQLVPAQANYVFIDEIQNATEFERVVDGLFILPNVDLYLTGSSSALLAGQLASLLTGRYVELGLLPLSFSEYVAARGGTGAAVGLRDLYDDYIRHGSFPFVLTLDSDTDVRQYLESVFDTILLRDVAAARRVADVGQLRSVAEFLYSAIGSVVSVNSIANTMTSAGRKISRPTVEGFVAALADAHLVYPARRWDVKGKRLLESGTKYYAVDVGLRRALLGAKPVDAGHVLENVVYLELLRRGGKVYSGSVGRTEVDFVVENDSETTFIQVAFDVNNPATLERELAPLRSLPGFDTRLLLTMDREPPQSYDGIRRRSVLEWLATS